MVRAWLLMFSLGTLMAVPPVVEGQESTTTLSCTSNAKASRDYAFRESEWEGGKAHVILDRFIGKSAFDVSIKEKERKDSIMRPLRDKVFSGLNTKSPIVRSITRYSDGVEQAEEFSGMVVSRASDTIFLMWTNDLHNKVWLAAVNLKHRKVALAQVFEGVTSVGGELETLDCR